MYFIKQISRYPRKLGVILGKARWETKLPVYGMIL